ncbi:MAG: bifunctional folylpolyglutamate synthase/dihydrofolate synthase [Lachnospiraceae bacterium]|jgi:dihydrofolate synthase/folylpolyglutamate synthase|nr:bifunctional folylpolyglutamate synthase/dihydrofolate synthase [Lachnospiraceae bacterium]
MTYREACEYIAELQGQGIRPGLETIRGLCARLGNPQDGLSFVHIAGTNGKGSVLAFVSTALKAAGYRCGRFFSPSLREYRERIQINNRMISQADFARLLARVKEAAEGMAAAGLAGPTAFEADVALALLYFAERGCDVVVLEAGLGGRDDATNIVENTLAAVLAPIGLDHSEWLGEELAEIAAHKADIIKSGAAVVCAAGTEEVLAVVRAKAGQCGCPMQVSPLERVRRVKAAKPDGKALVFRQRFSYGGLADVEISLAGRHQIDNAVLAIDTLRALAEQGFKISEKQLRRGLREAVWPGRFQLLRANPYFIIDGAHNPAAATVLAAAIKFYFTGRQIVYIIGVLADKDYRGIIAATHELAAHIVTVTPPAARGLPAYELAQAAAAYHLRVTAADSVHEACELAVLLAGKDGVVIAFGSLAYLGGIIHDRQKKG